MTEVTFFFKKDNNRDLFYGKIAFTDKVIFENAYNLHKSVNAVIKPYVLSSINWLNSQADMNKLRILSITIIGVSIDCNSDYDEEISNDILDLHIIYDGNDIIINGYKALDALNVYV
jgi:hypothetical protein